MSGPISFLHGKNILLLYARFFGYDTKVKEKLESMGANVTLFDARANLNSFEKAIKKVTRYFYVKKQHRFHKRIISFLAGADIDIIFSNEFLDSSVLKLYKQHFPRAKFVLYMDDSVENFKGIEDTFEYYDKVLTFDRLDSIKYNISFRPLFYCDCFKSEDTHLHYNYDISFVGTCHSDRIRIIDLFIKNRPNLNIYLYRFLPSRFMFVFYKLFNKSYKNKRKNDFKYVALSLDETSEIMKESKIVLDINHPKQSGLTMRSIEAFGCKRKVITTNKDIANYDFYDVNNVFIIDRDNPVISDDFISSNYKENDDDLIEKYSLFGWVIDVFGGLL